MLNMTKISSADACKVVVHEQDTPPHGLLGYAPVFARRADENAYNLIKIDYTITEIDLLPPPFETNCRSYNESDNLRSLCIDECLNMRYVKNFHKVPFTTLQMEPVPLKHINNNDVINSTFAKLMDRVDHICDRSCSQPACETEHYSTYLQKEEESELDFFAILLQAPTLPNINVTSGQKVQLSDFMIYVTSCIGTWFGASALTFSPLKLRHVLGHEVRNCGCRFCYRINRRINRQIVRIKTLSGIFPSY
jgi:hypothetical protein